MEINANIDLILEVFVMYMDLEHKKIVNKNTSNIIYQRIYRNIEIIDPTFTINNYEYYNKYFFTIFNQIKGLREIIYLGSEINNKRDSATQKNISIMTTTNKILEGQIGDSYKTLKKVLNKLFKKYPNLNHNSIANFISNIEILEKTKDKLIFFNENKTTPIHKNTDCGIPDDKFISRLYEEYLENHFRIMIIQDDRRCEIGLEYKE